MKLALALAALVALASCGRQAPPAVFGSVPAFTLTAESGKAFGSAVLQGKVWVADFIYTTCQGPCPRMSSQMRKVQNSTAPAVMLVSFTVDPEHDTPPVLAAYAKRYQAVETRWRFLTGPRTALQQLSKSAFKLGDVDGKLEHSTRFVLVDRKSRIRGYYSTWEEDGLKKLLADIEAVSKETD